MFLHRIIDQGAPSLKENVDPNEIAKFNAFACHWWNLEGESKILHRINPLRLDYIMDRTVGLFGKQVLDVGCGGGILTESMALEGAKVVGLDMSEKVLAIARFHAIETGIDSIDLDYRYETIESHSKTHVEYYDVITCMELLEHVPDPISIIMSCAKLVKPGGDVFFSTLNRNLKAKLITILFAEYILGIIPRGTHDINKFIKPSELLNWIDDTDLREQHIVGLNYNLLRNCFYLCNNVDFSYILHVRREV